MHTSINDTSSSNTGKYCHGGHISVVLNTARVYKKTQVQNQIGEMRTVKKKNQKKKKEEKQQNNYNNNNKKNNNNNPTTFNIK